MENTFNKYIEIQKEIYEYLRSNAVDIAVNKITCSIKNLCLLSTSEIIAIDSTTTN